MKKPNILKWIILGVAIIINVFILVNACIEGGASAQESGRVARFFANIINFFAHDAINSSNFDSFAYVIRKLIGHFGLFAVDGVVSTYAIHLFTKETKFKYVYFTIGGSLIFGLLIASVSEIIQIFTPDRYGSWGDIGIDFAGYFLGTGLIILILFLNKQVKFAKDKNIEDLS